MKPKKKKCHLVSKDIMSNQFIILLIKYPWLYFDAEKKGRSATLRKRVKKYHVCVRAARKDEKNTKA